MKENWICYSNQYHVKVWLHGNPFCTTLPTLPIILVKNKPEIIYAEEVEGAVLEDLPASAYTTFRLLGSMSTPPPLENSCTQEGRRQSDTALPGTTGWRQRWRCDAFVTNTTVGTTRSVCFRPLRRAKFRWRKMRAKADDNCSTSPQQNLCTTQWLLCTRARRACAYGWPLALPYS